MNAHYQQIIKSFYFESKWLEIDTNIVKNFVFNTD